MSYGEKRKVVYFNLDSDEQRELYELAMSLDFSAEVKKWLTDRLRRRKLTMQHSTTQHSDVTVNTSQLSVK